MNAGTRLASALRSAMTTETLSSSIPLSAIVEYHELNTPPLRNRSRGELERLGQLNDTLRQPRIGVIEHRWWRRFALHGSATIVTWCGHRPARILNVSVGGFGIGSDAGLELNSFVDLLVAARERPPIRFPC